MFDKKNVKQILNLYNSRKIVQYTTVNRKFDSFHFSFLCLLVLFIFILHYTWIALKTLMTFFIRIIKIQTMNYKSIHIYKLFYIYYNTLIYNRHIL